MFHKKTKKIIQFIEKCNINNKIKNISILEK